MLIYFVWKSEKIEVKNALFYFGIIAIKKSILKSYRSCHILWNTNYISEHETEVCNIVLQIVIRGLNSSTVRPFCFSSKCNRIQQIDIMHHLFEKLWVQWSNSNILKILCKNVRCLIDTSTLVISPPGILSKMPKTSVFCLPRCHFTFALHFVKNWWVETCPKSEILCMTRPNWGFSKMGQFEFSKEHF